MFRSNNKSVVKFSIAFATMFFSCLCTFAQEEAKVPVPQGNNYDTLRYTLLVVAGLLVLVIGVLSSVTGVTAKLFSDKQKKEKEGLEVKPVIGVLLFLFTSFTAFADDKPAVKEAIATGPALPWDIYLFLSVVALEVIIILFLVKMIYGFLELKKEKALVVKPKKSLFKKITAPVAVEEEAKLDLHHDYDGIRELDNDIPGWWKLAFVGTFIFGIIYLYRMFGSGSMPDQLQELAIANDVAEMQKTEYLLHAANNIDENTVKMMGAEDVIAGQELYTKNCVACHGDKGQGGVGPNFTDEYWLHKGSINAIFYSIKYGWQEKGMKAWKEDFSPNQIAQLSSYINSIKNTNVAGGKEKQGELYTDSTVVSVSSLTAK